MVTLLTVIQAGEKENDYRSYLFEQTTVACPHESVEHLILRKSMDSSLILTREKAEYTIWV